jgi:PAS domain S-box-containing protein
MILPPAPPAQLPLLSHDPATLAALVELCSDPVLLLGRDLGLQQGNAACRAWLGDDAAQGWQLLREAAGPRLNHWLHQAADAIATGRASPTAPALKLADGQRARLHLLAYSHSDLPAARWMLHVHLAQQLAGAAEVSAREQADRAQLEIEQWFALSPLPMLLVDATGLVLRSNAPLARLCLDLPTSLYDAPEPLRQLLAWPEGPLLRHPAELSPQTTEAQWLDPQGRNRWLRGRLRALKLGAQHRLHVLAVLEDRSAEHERDLAHQQLDTLIDTAGVGVATFQPEAGWLRPRRGAGRSAKGSAMTSLQGINREMVEAGSLPEFERLQRALKRGDPVEARYAVRHPELGRRWLLTRVSPGPSTSGQRTTSVVTLDVTAQAQAESALQLRAESERAVLDSVLVGIVTVGPAGIEWMNRSARRMFDCELEDVLGQPMGVLAPDDDDHPFHHVGVSASGAGQSEMFECQLRGRDGREFWVIGNAVQTAREDGDTQLTYALLDIDRRRQAEAQTRQAQASLARIIEAAPLAISLHDADTLRIEKLNQAAAALARRDEASLLGGLPEDLFGAEQGAAIRRDMLAALQFSAVTQREYRLGEGPDARVWDTRFLHLAGTTSGLSAEGTPEQLLVVASDVTEHRAAEEARLQAAISQRELLVREVHHRIKNNLQGVAGLLQQIAARRPEVADVLREAVGQVQAIAQVYGLQVGATGPLHLRKVWEAIIGSVQRMRGRTFATAIEGEALAGSWALPEAESIPIALSLNELLGNAMRHSPDATVRCHLICGESGVTVEIINTGRLPAGFHLKQVPSGVSGLGLVRALLPRRSAILSLEQQGDDVVCRLELLPPSVLRHGG